MERAQIQILTSRVLEPVRYIQVLVGPRQVGKTTLVKQLLDKGLVPGRLCTAEDAGTETWLRQQWEQARLMVKQSQNPFLLVIDEVQKLHQWSEQVKLLWDQDRLEQLPLAVVLLGSSKLLVQQGLTESLAGRHELIHLPHWRYSEMQEAFNFSPEEYVWFGGYPGAAGLIGNEQRWKSYVSDALIEAAISKDVLQMTRVDKPALLRRSFAIGCRYSGQILSYTKLLGQLQDAGNTTTLAHYLDLLDGVGLLGGLDKFANDVARQRASSPKFQVYNTALINAQSPATFSEVQGDPAQWGRQIESAIGMHLLSYRHEGLQLQYWRQGDAEVDFVLRYKSKTVALEVKSGKDRRSGMDLFVKNFKPDKIYQVSDTTISWQAFIQMNPMELF